MSLLRILLGGLLALLASCGNSEDTPAKPLPKVIVGGTLIDGTGRPPIPDALIVVENGKVKAAGAMKDLKVPEPATRTNATGLFITPTQTGARIEYDAPADLFLVQGNPIDNPMVLMNPMRVMKAGEWTDAARR